MRKVWAGKFRRYNWTRQEYFENWQIALKDVIGKNILGLCGFVGGVIQSFGRLVGREQRPDVVFLKGGFVGLPVGLVSRWLRIPYVVHESDAVPGLANRILMKHATVIGCGLELKVAPGLESRCVVTGIPVAAEFKPVTIAKQRALKQTFGFDPDEPLVIITGGSQGSEHLNAAVREILPELLEFASVGLAAGRKHYEDMVDLKKYENWERARLKSNFRLWEFCTVMSELMGAADVVVSRAGATTIAELAALKKAAVLVPFEKLTGGHQVQNAKSLLESKAALVVRDDRMVQQPGILLKAVQHLVRSPKEREKMAGRLYEKARAGAAKELAEILLTTATERGK